MVNALKINPKDNVVVALSDLAQGTRLEFRGEEGESVVITTDAIPFGHKIAIAPITRGQTVIKYGASIGLADSDIAPGQHVHVHNLKSVRGAAKR